MTATLAATAGNLIQSNTLIFTVALGSYNGSIKATDYILLKWDTTKNAIKMVHFHDLFISNKNIVKLVNYKCLKHIWVNSSNNSNNNNNKEC